jgi:hypothetical protein
LYVSRTNFGAFVETFVREPATALISSADLAARGLSELSVTRPLRLLELMGAGLTAMGVTALITATPEGDYNDAQAISHWAFNHPSGFDGIAYMARHDNEQLCVALFDRASAALTIQHGPTPWNDSVLLSQVLSRYEQLGLTD